MKNVFTSPTHSTISQKRWSAPFRVKMIMYYILIHEYEWDMTDFSVWVGPYFAGKMYIGG